MAQEHLRVFFYFLYNERIGKGEDVWGEKNKALKECEESELTTAHHSEPLQ